MTDAYRTTLCSRANVCLIGSITSVPEFILNITNIAACLQDACCVAMFGIVESNGLADVRRKGYDSIPIVVRSSMVSVPPYMAG